VRRLVLSPDAAADISAIGKYSRRAWGADQGRHNSQQLADQLIKLKQRTRPGRPRPDIGAAVRSLKSGRHVIFFHLEDEQVVVARIPHESMNVVGRIEFGPSGSGVGVE